MARRTFIKAYNDMVNSSGQSSVGGVNISEFSNNGMSPFTREVTNIGSKKSSVKLSNSEKVDQSRYLVKPKSCHTPSLSNRNLPAGVKWDTTKQKDRKNSFIEIDGDSFPPEELNEEENEVIDTSHKVQRYMSLVDLARPYIPRAPTNMARVVRENREKGMLKNDDPITAQNLTKGSNESNQPYVIPKFTPSFREMISTRDKKDTLVSITESLPPSMQKWAVEWNADRRHSISVAELKEDLKREKLERNTQRSSNNTDLIFAEEDPTSSADARPDESTESTSTVSKFSSAEGTQNTSEPRAKNRYYYADHSKASIMPVEPPEYQQKLEQLEADDAANTKVSKLSLDWLPEKYENMKRVFKGLPKERYSFRDTIREKANLDGPRESSEQTKVPSLLDNADEEFSFSEDSKKFHQWFLNRQTGKDDVSTTQNKFSGADGYSKDPFHRTGTKPQYITSGREVELKSVTYSDGDPTWNKLKENPDDKHLKKKNGGIDTFEKNSSSVPDHISLKDEKNEPHAEEYMPEKNSSFYHWLKQRGLVNVTKKRTSEKQHKPARVSEVVKPESKFPWSMPYTCKYVPRVSENKQESKDSWKGTKLAGNTNFSANKTNPSQRTGVRKVMTQGNIAKKKNDVKKVKSEGTLERRIVKKSRFIQDKTGSKKNIQAYDDGYEGGRDGTPGSIPYFGWVVGNELDHVKNLRSMENYYAAPQLVNRKKLFPSLREQISSPSLNYWASKYNSTIKKSKADDLFAENNGASDIFKYDGLPSQQVTIPESTGNIENVTSNSFEDRNFINIFDEPTVSFQNLVNDGENPHFLHSNKPNRVDDDDDEISRYGVKLKETSGKKISDGDPALTPKQCKSAEGNAPLHLQFSRNVGLKTKENIGDGVKVSMPWHGQLDKEDELSASGNEVEQEWLNLINPQGFDMNEDNDLINIMNTKRPGFKPSTTSPHQS